MITNDNNKIRKLFDLNSLIQLEIQYQKNFKRS